MSWRTQAGLVAVPVVIVSQMYHSGPLAWLVLAGALIGINVIGAYLLARRGRNPRQSSAAASAHSFSVPLATSWLIVSLIPMHDFDARSSADALTGLSREALVEFALFGVVGVLAAWTIKTFEPSLQNAQPPALLFALPIWTIASAAWGQWPAYTLARGLQFIAIVFLAWATIVVGRVDPTTIYTIVSTYVRWFVRVTLALAVAGALFGPLFVSLAAANVGRFSWPGAHPTASGIILTAAIILLIATPPAVLRLPVPVVGASLVGLFVALYLNHSRTSWVALVIAAALALGIQGRISPKVAAIGVPLAGAATTAALWLNGTAIWDYVLRDRSSESLRTGSGRLELWSIGTDAFDGIFDWFAGMGFGAVRTVFLEDAFWAGTAHNSVLAWLVNLGLVGAATFVFTVLVVAARALRQRLWAVDTIGIPLTALLAIMVVQGMTSDTLAEPNLGFAVLCLGAAASVVISFGDAHLLARDSTIEGDESAQPDGRARRKAGTST